MGKVCDSFCNKEDSLVHRAMNRESAHATWRPKSSSELVSSVDDGDDDGSGRESETNVKRDRLVSSCFFTTHGRTVIRE